MKTFPLPMKTVLFAIVNDLLKKNIIFSKEGISRSSLTSEQRVDKIKKIKAERKMIKGSNRGTGVRAFIILVMWERSIAIE